MTVMFAILAFDRHTNSFAAVENNIIRFYVSLARI